MRSSHESAASGPSGEHGASPTGQRDSEFERFFEAAIADAANAVVDKDEANGEAVGGASEGKAKGAFGATSILLGEHISLETSIFQTRCTSSDT
jgi:hypothetical protein